MSEVDGRGSVRFRLRLHPRRQERVRWVIVRAFGLDGGPTRTAIARVRGG
jgi:hypothetical protein